jgi:hypothetical protein
MDLETQRDRLRALAEAEKVDLKPVAKLPDDPRLQIAAFATLLGIDPMEAMHNASVKKLVADARKQQRASERYLRQELKRLDDLGIPIDELPQP